MTTLTLKIENDLKKDAQGMAEEMGVSLSALIKMLLKNTIRTGKVDIQTKPNYHSEPEPGDLNFDNLNEAIAYFEKELKKNKRIKKNEIKIQEKL